MTAGRERPIIRPPSVRLPSGRGRSLRLDGVRGPSVHDGQKSAGDCLHAESHGLLPGDA